MKVAGSVVIVTGASAGIGAETVRLLAAQGANVVLTARRAERLQALVAELAHYPGQRLALAGDVSQEAFCQELAAQTAATFGRVDVLVNNAGIGHRSALLEMSAADVQIIANTNLLGAIYAIQAVLPTMQKQKRGQIINVSSIVSQQALPKSSIYCAAKSGLNTLSRSLRMELRGQGITVTLVYPGLTETEFYQVRLGEQGTRRINRPGVPAQRVGEAIVNAITHNRQEVYITLPDWLLVHTSRLFPRTLDWFVGRLA